MGSSGSSTSSNGSSDSSSFDGVGECFSWNRNKGVFCEADPDNLGLCQWAHNKWRPGHTPRMGKPRWVIEKEKEKGKGKGKGKKGSKSSDYTRSDDWYGASISKEEEKTKKPKKDKKSEKKNKDKEKDKEGERGSMRE